MRAQRRSPHWAETLVTLLTGGVPERERHCFAVDLQRLSKVVANRWYVFGRKFAATSRGVSERARAATPANRISAHTHTHNTNSTTAPPTHKTPHCTHNTTNIHTSIKRGITL
jgi:hypothetical protein